MGTVLRLITTVHVFLDVANITFDFAAPLKTASTSFPDHDLLRPEPSTAAHHLASVRTERGRIADASVRSGYTQSGISCAELGRRFEEDEIHQSGSFGVGVVGLQTRLVPVAFLSREQL